MVGALDSTGLCNIDGLVQERRNSIANTLELRIPHQLNLIGY